MNDLERFESHLSYVGDCWIWESCMSGRGRTTPCFSVAGKMKSAQRWIFQQVYGEIPPSRPVINRCGNLRCVNPAHHSTSSRKAEPDHRKLPPLQGPPRPAMKDLPLHQQVARKSLAYALRIERAGAKCQDCGKAITPSATRCRACWNGERTKVFSRSPEARLRNHYRAWKFRRTGVAS